MQAEIITVGDELCRGEIVDTNASWLAAELWALDVPVAWMTSCRDLATDFLSALRSAAARAHLILVSGGLGSTEDDLTVDAMAELVGVLPEIHQPSLARMSEYFSRAKRPVTINSTRQVRVPAGARVYPNPVGLAPAFEVTFDRSTIICLPGVPRELKAIYRGSVAPRVREMLGRLGQAFERIARKTYRVFGRGESEIAAGLQGIAGGVVGATLHYRVDFPETLVKVVVRDQEVSAARDRLEDLDREIRARLGRWLYGTGEERLPAVLVRQLAAAGATLATAESCTGGQVGGLVTAVPGASEVYLGGAVTYTDEEKVRQLGVSRATLDESGAVSEACVREMARGVRARTGATYGVAVSGIAGPGGGTEAKPVGTVWIAASGPDGDRVKHFVWPGERDRIRTLASYWALATVLRAL